MLKRLYKRLEIMGYSRAIGALYSNPQVPNSHVKALIEARDELRAELKALKARKPEDFYKRGAKNA